MLTFSGFLMFSTCSAWAFETRIRGTAGGRTASLGSDGLDPTNARHVEDRHGRRSGAGRDGLLGASEGASVGFRLSACGRGRLGLRRRSFKWEAQREASLKVGGRCPPCPAKGPQGVQISSQMIKMGKPLNLNSRG